MSLKSIIQENDNKSLHQYQRTTHELKPKIHTPWTEASSNTYRVTGSSNMLTSPLKYASYYAGQENN